MRLFRTRSAASDRDDGSPVEEGRLDSLTEGVGPLQAIDRLTEANRIDPEPGIERRLVEIRHHAFADLKRTSGGPTAPSGEPVADLRPGGDGLPRSNGLPEVAATGLSAATVRAAIVERGSLIVRGLIDEARARDLIAGIDRAFEARDAYLDGAAESETAPWFVPFETDPSSRSDPGGVRQRVRKGAAWVWAADSPRMLFEQLEAFADAGVPELVTGYLGERPAMPMNKAVLRRVPPDGGGAWHQDGAFLGESIRTLNVWTSLTHCGRDAPGLQVVPRRLDEILETGTEGAYFEWSVSPQVVEDALRGEPAARPIFAPGDAILFDHMCLHSTATDPGMTETRYATETWCFAPSTYPDKQPPLVL